MKKVTVFFDLEGGWHKPERGDIDLASIVGNILEILESFGVKAVFNTCGIVAEKWPEVVESIHEHGHEIASHGYVHENFSQLSPEEFNAVLMKTEHLIEDLIGARPLGVRSPWLVYNDAVYKVIGERGYRWVSNRHLTHPELWTRPASYFFSGSHVVEKLPFTSKFSRNINYWWRWRNFPKKPFSINGLLEIPLLASMDGELLHFLTPTQNSPDVWLDYAFSSWVNQLNRSEEYFNLNLHPWFIGSSNRPSLLKRILEYVSGMGVEFVLAGDLKPSD